MTHCVCAKDTITRYLSWQSVNPLKACESFEKTAKFTGKISSMKKLIFIVGAIALAAFGYLTSQGLLQSAQVQKGTQGGFILLGVDHTGSYYTIGDAFEELKEIYPTGQFTGVYFDNPDSIPSEDLRSFAGLKVSAAEGLREMGKNHHLRMHNIEQRPAHFVDWDCGESTVGIILGSMKAYPALGLASEATGWTGDAVIAYEEYTDTGVRFVMQH